MEKEMNNKKSYLTQRQLLFLMIQAQIGVGILSLPYSVLQKASTDGWISIIIAGIFVQILLIIYIYMFKLNKGLNIYDIGQKYLGNLIAYVVKVGYFLYFTYTCIIMLVIFTNFMNIWLFPFTPRLVINFSLIFVCVYLVRESLITIARFFVLTSIIFIFFIITTVMAYTNVHLLYLFPIGQAGIKNIFMGSFESTIAFLGFEILLVVHPFIQQAADKKANTTLKTVSLAHLFIVLLYLFVVITSYTFFSPDELMLVPYPTVYMLKAFTSTVIDRIDIIFIPLWCIAVMTSFMSYLYLASFTLAKCFKSKEHRRFVPITGVVILLLSFIPMNNLLITKLSNILGIVSMIFIGIIPIILFLYSIIWKERRD
ncbi:GerAB/ArcD/ProY family transporter [Evansella clarkii]|uniref:GerAB/ArcD/ProY family transporter n=1 Tax=Evansella clarkii TaxID=79879 RepID=UPI0009986D8B|nr:endospore germination permease [Evansella clarkii]